MPGFRDALRRAGGRLDERIRLRELLRLFRVGLRRPRRLAGDRAAIAAGPGVYFLELGDLALGDPGAFGQQVLEHPRPGTEHCCPLHQRTVAIEGLAEGRAKRHCVTLVARPLAQLVPRRQDLGALGRERVHRRAVVPAVDGVADFMGDAHDRVVVRRGLCLGLFFLAFAETAVLRTPLPAVVVPDAGARLPSHRATCRPRRNRAPPPWAASATNARPDTPARRCR